MLGEKLYTGASHAIAAIQWYLHSFQSPDTLCQSPTYWWTSTREKIKTGIYLNIWSACCAGTVLLGLLFFSPIGNKKQDNNQTLSCSSHYLRANDAVTPTELHKELHSTYTYFTAVESMTSVPNISGLLETESCTRRDLPAFSRFSGFHHFGHEEALASCKVNDATNGDWTWLHWDKTAFLTHTRLSATLPTSVQCPDGMEQVTRLIKSEESRANSAARMAELFDHRNNIFKAFQGRFNRPRIK